jgi:hypothetical protein
VAQGEDSWVQTPVLQKKKNQNKVKYLML